MPQFLQVGRARVFHYDVGAGPLVVLLHGFNHHAEAWVRNIGPLSGAGFRAVALDLPGFGRSGVPRMRYSLEGYADFMLRFIAALDGGPAHLVGSSMGGAIAFETALDHDDAVLTVTGVDTAGMFAQVPRTWALATNPLARAALRPFLGQRRLIEWSHRNAYHDRAQSTPRQTDLIAESWIQPGYKDHILGMAETMFATPRKGNLWERLPGLRQPVLIAWGRQDRTISVQHAYRAAYRVPDAQLVIYDRCGHLPMYEKADDFNRDLVDFLRRQGAARGRRAPTAGR